MTPLVVQEQVGRVLVVSIAREAKRNAVDREVTEALDAALTRLDDDPDLWAGVLTGTATVFSAGTDLSERRDLRTDRGGEYGLVRRQRRKPLVAAVEGLALGGGFEMVLACDLVVASRTAAFGLPEVLRGTLASSGALFRAARLLPRAVALELLLTGRRLDAERAHAFGLVNELTEPGGARDAAVALAQEVCLASPVSVRETLAALQALDADGDAHGWRATEEALAAVLACDDVREGVTAFLEKRRPQWSGR